MNLLSVVRTTGVSLRELATVMQRLPQVLVNVPVGDKDALDDAAGVWDAVQAEQDALGEDGRVLVRPSGTEPVVRVMVEAASEADAQASADRIAVAIEGALGGAAA